MKRPVIYRLFIGYLHTGVYTVWIAVNQANIHCVVILTLFNIYLQTKSINIRLFNRQMSWHPSRPLISRLLLGKFQRL
jgi:hypothetical protein